MLLNYRKLVFLFALNFFPWEFLLIKKLEIEKTKNTKNTTFKTDIIKVILVFSISKFFTNENSQGRKFWTDFSLFFFRAPIFQSPFVTIKVFSMDIEVEFEHCGALKVIYFQNISYLLLFSNNLQTKGLEIS